MLIEHQGRKFSTILGSDVIRDGIFLELSEVGSPSPLMEVFYSDADGSFSISVFGVPVPLAVVEQVIVASKQLLPPSSTA